MKITRGIPAYLGTGCLAIMLGAAGAVAQSSAGSSGSSPSGPGSVPQSSAGSPGTAGTAGTTGTAGTAGSVGQTSDTSASASGGGASAADKSFVKKAMEGSMAEIQLGQLATQKASSDDVKQFGQKMVDDHTKLSEQMKPVASQLGITPPSSLPAKDKALESKLKGLSGEAFDKAYMQAMVKDHHKDLSEFQKEASNGKSSAVKDAAAQGQQVISEHLKMAEQIAQKHGGGGTSSGMASGNGPQ